MATGVTVWSKTAASNNSADSAVNWAEGQPPSSVNDSARGMMAATAKWRDDISGTITTGGTSTAYTVASNQSFSTLAYAGASLLAFIPHTTNGATVTLNVDSLGAKPLRSAPGVELIAGTLVEGTPYCAKYNASDDVWYLFGYYQNPFTIPLGGGLDFWGATVPNSAFAFPAGQAISRSVYSALFTMIGTTHGSGDGSTTFNLPDKTGRVSAMKEASATRLTSTYFGGNSANIGATGGSESHTLTSAQIPAHSHPNSLNDGGHIHDMDFQVNNAAGGSGFAWSAGGNIFTRSTKSATTGITITNASAGGDGAHKNVQPTIICNYIMRII